MTLLDLDGVTAGYGAMRVLHGLSLRIAEGEVVALVGRNGMGKTTTIRTMLGLLPLQAGCIRFAGSVVSGQAPCRIARAGIGLAPEGRQVFADLTVRENLTTTARGSGPWTLDRVLALFPRLAERAGTFAGRLSGGEQQMLSIGRALMTNPRLLVLDEATEGLAPLMRAEIWRVLAQLRETGMAILVVDKNLDQLARLADRHCVMVKGRVAWSGDGTAFAAARSDIAGLLGV
jgi:branched-chain amino acid transport system ATP-binding protein